MTRTRPVLPLLISFVFGATLASPAVLGQQPETYAKAAEDKEDNEKIIDELVVTAARYVSTGGRSANKSDIPLVETPQSVTVISRDMMDLLNMKSLNESMRYVSGGTGEAFGPDERYDWLTVRGFSPVQYIDGVRAPIASVNNAGTDLYGSESVEILKGPSSVLYGQNPPGGIVNMTSRRPRQQFGGEVGVQLGEYNHRQINGDMTGALTDRVSGRFTMLYRDRETQVDLLRSKRLYVAPAITIDFTPDTSITLLANFQDDDLDNQSTGFLPAFGTSRPNPLGKVPVGRNLGEPGVNFFERTQYSAGYDLSHRFNDRVSIEQNFKYFDAEVRSRAIYGGGLRDQDRNGVPDDFRTVNRFDFPFNEDIESTNVDTRLNLLFDTGALEHSVLVGVDYRRYTGFSEYGFNTAPPIDLFEPVYGAEVGDGGPIFPFVDATNKQTGIYVQDQIRANRLIFTLSGRQDYLDTTSFGNSTDEDVFSYRAGVNYVFDNGISPYVQTARSFQPVAGADFSGKAFIPTTGTQFEAGLKYDGRGLARGLNVFASAAAYQIVQENILTPDPVNPNFRVQTGEVEVQGVEIEASARIYERLTFNFAYTYTDSEVTRSNTANLGKELVAVPKKLASLLIDYTFQTGPIAGFGAGAGIRYRGRQYGDALNNWPSDPVTVFDAILHYDTRKWRFTVNASNLTDKIFVDRCSSTSNCFYGTRRLVTTSFLRKF
jgi:iron complex outermembrane recepter protein